MNQGYTMKNHSIHQMIVGVISLHINPAHCSYIDVI